MKRHIFIMAVVNLLFVAAASANGVGTGGDPLSIEFDNARIYAANRVAGAVDCAMGANVPVSVREWILASKAALADDILGTKYIWSTESQVTCGWTQSTPKADITFSYPICRPAIKDVMDAIWMVVHESVHHLGFAEEAFPNAVADAIIDLGLNSSCTEPPAQDPFDPASCPGNPISQASLLPMVPLPYGNAKLIGDFNVYFRKRMCYSPILCKPWTTGLDDVNEFSYGSSRDGSQRGFLPTHGQIDVVFANNRVSLNLVSDTSPAGPGWAVHEDIDDKLNLHEAAGSTPVLSYMPLLVGQDMLGALGKINGWATNTCLRQTISGVTSTVDDKGNSITWYYDAVILGNISHQ